MTVAELIEYLSSQPKDLTVIYQLYSEACVLEADRIKIAEYQGPRPDGWVHTYDRPWDKTEQDRPKRMYLVLPGN
jgi:hypothetical protein